MVGRLLICGQPIFGRGGLVGGVRCGWGGKYSPGILLVTQIINVSPLFAAGKPLASLPRFWFMPGPSIHNFLSVHNATKGMQCHFVNGKATARNKLGTLKCSCIASLNRVAAINHQKFHLIYSSWSPPGPRRLKSQGSTFSERFWAHGTFLTISLHFCFVLTQLQMSNL